MPAINANLKSLREVKGMTQAEVAEVISVTRQTVSSYESGRTQPDLETLKRLAEVYQADLHDVLYGGNRLQQRLKRVQTAIIILAAVLLMGILARSILYWSADTFFPLPATGASEDNRHLVEMRFALREVAEQVSGICSTIYWVGCIATIYPAMSVINAISFRKLCLFLIIMNAAIFAFAIPFAAPGTVNSIIDSLASISVGVIFTFLLFTIALLTKLIKHRRVSKGA